MMHIIDNKKIDLTSDEWNLYVEICRSYDRVSFKGEELFRGLFETDDNGIIVFIKPPSERHTSMEVIIFIVSIMHQQHLRLFHKKVDDLCSEMRAKMEKILEK